MKQILILLQNEAMVSLTLWSVKHLTDASDNKEELWRDAEIAGKE